MTTPALSVVVVVHASARQAENVLASLSPSYQEGVLEPYEVIVVEAHSHDLLGESRAAALGPHARYVSISGGATWRARAVEAGISAARAPILGLFQDGAHLVTPRVLSLALRAFRDWPRPLVAVADYTFDPKQVSGAGDADGELEWLAARGWQDAPYSLFDAAIYGPAAINGPLSPLLGASVLFFSRAHFEAIPGIDPSLDRPGTGVLRLHHFTQLCKCPATVLVTLSGEGAFRQAHPEITTEDARRDEASLERLMVTAVLGQGPGFRGVHRQPVTLGEVGSEARPHVDRSAILAEWHCAVCRNKGEPPWYEDSAASA